MRSNIRAMNRLLAALALGLAGCAHVPNQFAEDGPASIGAHESATAQHAVSNYQPAAPRQRSWSPTVATAQDGAVTHWPLYTEDPFEDKGTDRPEGPNRYYIGWEDYVALPYCFSRYTLNWIALPVSMVVQPPWMLMESDGELSKQALGYDHDATPKSEITPPAATDSAESKPAEAAHR